MTYIVAVIAWAVVEVAAISGAVYLASQGKDGWGWLIFLALVLSQGSIKE